MERWCNDSRRRANYGGVCDVHRLQLQAATDDYRASRIGSCRRAGRWRRSTAGRPARGTTNSARYAGFSVTSTARSPHSGKRGPWAWIRSPARRCCAAAPGDADDGVDGSPARACRRGPAGPACGCCAARSRWRWPASASTRPKDIAGTGIRCRGVRHAGLSRMGGACARCPARCSRAARRAARCAARRRCGSTGYSSPATRPPQVYEWMALAHRALGDDELAAADAATAENIYAQLGVEPAGSAVAARPAG